MNTLVRTLRRIGAGSLLVLGLGLGLIGAGSATAKEAVPAVEDPVLEAKLVRIAAELRCLVCQNQTIADSNADLAVDLRRQVREMLQRGDSEREILDYMTARYGDFVLYRPPLKGSTAVLWFGPALLLFVGAGVLFFILRRRSRLAADRFEPDMDPYDTDELDPSAAPRVAPAPPTPPAR
jgi:cytochrome c-type biogenesis protein CcmH